jgi:phosphorylase kinase alpha/beta subunit
LSSLLRCSYSKNDIKNIFLLLNQKHTFFFPQLENGLFPAAHPQLEADYTGYSNIWVRDNIHIAHAHYLCGHTSVALKNITTLTDYFVKHQFRFEKILSEALSFNVPMNRPHIRFDGNRLDEINQQWSHAQNDALGYFLWLFCKLHNEDVITNLTTPQKKLLALFVLYFAKIEYWQDADSGHWEEARKIEASSIGVVIAALLELRKIVIHQRIQYEDNTITVSFLDELIEKGRSQLEQILPAECNQPLNYRRYDAALLFLIFPLSLITDTNMVEQIVSDVTTQLQGDYGVRRYIGDSYWAADYKDKVVAEERTLDVSTDMSSRNQLLQKGQEAQWCIFDPIISIIYGLKYKVSHDAESLKLQTHYFNRALGQITSEDNWLGAFKCPESYYLERGVYVPNDVTPLLWTQANLLMAFKFMEENASN